MKIAILHDYFMLRGGGERIIINLARALKADVYTGFVDRKNTLDMSGLNVVEIGRKVSNPLIRAIYLMERFKRLKLSGYGFFIFSGTLCISAVHNRPNLLYLHTPPRHMYDLKDWFYNNAGFAGKTGLKLLHTYLYPRDQKYMKQFDVICPNSENVKNRVRRYYGEDLYRKCIVVHPNIETKKFYTKSSEFFLSASRLDTLKRIGIIINAFREMPQEKLRIIGTGPEEQRLQALAKGCRNITFTGALGDDKLLGMLARCKAVISANIDEDFGLSAVECQAAGKPAIVVREGGFVETVVEGKTGMFFEPNTASLVETIIKFNKMKWNVQAIRHNAMKYDVGVFVRKIKRIIGETQQARRH